MILKQLIEMRVDTEKFDLTQYTEEAEFAGWANDPANGIWYLAESFCGDYETRGLSFEIIPNDPYVGES